MNRQEMLGSWYDLIKGEFELPYMKELMGFIRDEYKSGKTLLPRSKDIFRVFRETNLDDVKVVIIGVAPYSNEHANGIAFASDLQPPMPKPLLKLYETFNKQIQFGRYLDLGTGDMSLNYLKKQGVLLLNNRLTIVKGEPISHKYVGWEMFNSRVLLNLAKQKKNLAFTAWGGDPKKTLQVVYNQYKGEHFFHSCEHPIVAYHADRKWENGNVFDNINEYFKDNNKQEIIW